MEMEKVIEGIAGPELPNISIGQLILDRLRRSPLRIIQVDTHTGKIMTNHELLEKSVRLAVALQEWGLNTDDVVAISSESQSNWFVAACAVMYLSSCVAPLNPAYTESEILHTINISKPRIIFVSRRTSRHILQVVSKVPWKIELIQLDDENPIEKIITLGGMISQKKLWPDPHRYQAKVVEETSAKEVVILSSSGTTGMPKGVMLSNRNMMAALRAFKIPEFIAIDEKSIIIVFVPFFHGYGWGTMLSIIVNNATAIVIKTFEPQLFCESIQRYRVTIVPVVPSVMVFLAKHPMIDHYDFSSVKQIICAAASLSNEVHVAVKNRMGKATAIRNGYGMTELSIVTNVSPRFSNKMGTVGPMTPGTYCKVIDPETSESLGTNETGELCFKGDHVMLGYRGDPRATAETIDSDGWLHSGDLGYYDQDSHLFVVGRLKELIKYKGFQIAPAEIENLMLKHREVEDVAVVGRTDEVCGEIPVAFVVKRKGGKVTAEELTKFVNDQISVQKQLRGGVIFIEAIPKNPGGKILRRELLKLLSKL